MKLTKRNIERVAPGRDRVIVWDDEIRGVGLRIGRTGAKAFVVRYRPTAEPARRAVRRRTAARSGLRKRAPQRSEGPKAEVRPREDGY
jgi:hypothetical protein